MSARFIDGLAVSGAVFVQESQAAGVLPGPEKGKCHLRDEPARKNLSVSRSEWIAVMRLAGPRTPLAAELHRTSQVAAASSASRDERAAYPRQVNCSSGQRCQHLQRGRRRCCCCDDGRRHGLGASCEGRGPDWKLEAPDSKPQCRGSQGQGGGGHRWSGERCRSLQIESHRQKRRPPGSCRHGACSSKVLGTVQQSFWRHGSG